MNKNFTILLFLLFTSTVMAQSAGPKYVREAYTSFEAGKYFEAIDKCQAAFTKLGSKGSLKQKGDMAFKIAESYRLLERYESANEWLDVCVELKYFDINPNPPNKPISNQSTVLLSLKPFHKYKTVNAQKGIRHTFTLNSGVVKL